MNGVDATIVDRADYLVEIGAKGEDLVTACAKFSEKEQDDLKEAVYDSDSPFFPSSRSTERRIGGDSEDVSDSGFSKPIYGGL